MAANPFSVIPYYRKVFYIMTHYATTCGVQFSFGASKACSASDGHQRMPETNKRIWLGRIRLFVVNSLMAGAWQFATNVNYTPTCATG
jgi:hypothetical protein